MKPEFRKIVDRRKLRQIAGPQSFLRGKDYFEDGRVRVISEDKETFSAKVRGTRNYHVKIQIQGGAINYSCDCPMGTGDVFCKHLVAAGLTWIEGEAGGKKQSDQAKQAKPQVTTEDVCAYLLQQNKETLVKMLMEQTAEDDRLREQLFLKVAQKGSKGLDLATFRRAIDDSVDTGGFIDYRSMWDYCRQVEAVVDAIDELKEKHPSETIEIIEYFIEAVEERLGEVDDSDGGVGGILDRLQEIHHAACKKAKPDPVALAKRLFEWELETEYGTFYNAMQTYADIFGKKGIAEYRRLAEEEWRCVPPLYSGHDTSERYGGRFQITRIMEALAEGSGDIEALVAVKSRDLSDAYAYLSIAEIYKKSSQQDKSLEWAERGLKTFPQKTDSRLREFLAEEYHRRKRHDEAMNLMWAEFSEGPSLADYQKLKAHADRTDQWLAWREKAIAWVRERTAQEKKEDHGYSWGWNPDHSLLVEIFLWEKDDEAAWHEAKSGGCGRHLWLELAKKHEKSHPENALEVYQKLIEPTVDQKNNLAYEEAVGYLCKIKEAMERLHRVDEFSKYLECIRIAHKPKRNFMKLIDQKLF